MTSFCKSVYTPMLPQKYEDFEIFLNGKKRLKDKERCEIQFRQYPHYTPVKSVPEMERILNIRSNRPCLNLKMFSLPDKIKRKLSSRSFMMVNV